MFTVQHSQISRPVSVCNNCRFWHEGKMHIWQEIVGGMEMGGHASQKASTPNCPPRHLHMVPLWKLSAPVYAIPTSLNKEEKRRMVNDTDAGDSVSVKPPGGRQRETTSLLFPRIWLVR